LDLKEQSVSKETARHPWELARAKSVNDLINPYIEQSESIMIDFGCGDLFFLDHTLANYPKAYGYGFDIGFSEQDIDSLSDMYSRITAVNTKNKLDVCLENQRVDLVFLMDVIEHVEDDQAILESIIQSKWFDDKSALIITVPAFQFLFNSHDVFLEHYRRYTNKSLSKVAEAAGFTIIERGYFFSSLLMPRALGKIKETIIPPKSIDKSDLVNWKGGSGITNIITQVLYSDFKINHWLNKNLGLRMPGLSNYMVCQKPV